MIMYRKITAIAAILLSAFTLTAQNNISGKIVTSDGQPAAQVNIELKGLNKTCISNQDGYFEIKNMTS